MRLLLDDGRRRIAIEDGRIVAREGRFDATLDCRGAIVRPGLINAHDHLHRNHYGRLGFPPYANAYRWAEDIQQNCAGTIALGRLWPRRAALLDGAWKNLFAGVTTVVHHDAWESDFDRDFPIHVARVASVDSLGMSGMPEIADANLRQTNHRVPAKAGTQSHERNARNPGLLPAQGHNPCPNVFALHIAEGVDEEAAEEVRALDRAGLLGPALIGIHGVGMDADGIARWRTSGAALCWCPSSNLFLFGCTAPPGLFDDGNDILLGSDSLLTGAGDLLDELRVARRIGLLDDDLLYGAVGATAARRLGLPTPDLEPGSAADLIVLSRPLGEATAADVRLVLVDGRPRLADAAFAAILAPLFPGGRRVQRGALSRWAWGEIRDGTDLHRSAGQTGALAASGARP